MATCYRRRRFFAYVRPAHVEMHRPNTIWEDKMRLIHAAPLASLTLVAACASMPMMGGHGAAPSEPTAAPPPAAAPAPTQAPAAQPARISGIVTAIAGNQITITGADGASSGFTIAPDAWIVKGRPIPPSAIHAGDFVATANVNNPDGTGTSTELRVFPPGMHLGEGSYPMQQPNTTMTNATVAQVTNVGGGRQLTVTFGASESNGTPSGTRTITLPATVEVVQWYRVALTDLHAGNRVRGRGAINNGATVAEFLFADDPPPPAAPAPAPH
jgi:hypothetical protein